MWCKVPEDGAIKNEPETCFVFKEHSPVRRSDERVSPLQRLIIFGGDAEVSCKTCISNAGISHRDTTAVVYFPHT